jgi:hypothetical protein
MQAVQRWHGRLVATWAVVLVAAVAALILAALAGYMVKGSTTLVVKSPASVSPVQQQSVVRPYTEPHDIAPATSAGQGLSPQNQHRGVDQGTSPATGSGQGPFSEPHDVNPITGSGQGPFTEPHDTGR